MSCGECFFDFDLDSFDFVLSAIKKRLWLIRRMGIA